MVINHAAFSIVSSYSNSAGRTAKAIIIKTAKKIIAIRQPFLSGSAHPPVSPASIQSLMNIPPFYYLRRA
jgi:hypothetical protein